MTGQANNEAILQAIRRVLPRGSEPYALHEPSFQGREWEYVKECLDTGWVSSVGKYVDRFEEQLAQYTGSRFAVATVNGTASLHICLILAGVERDDEVLIPSLTFVATANAVAYCNATPHFVDSEEISLGVDAEKLGAYLAEICETRNGHTFNRRTGARIKAFVPMHVFGHPVDLEPLAELCRRYNIALIEDCAESLGSLYKGRHTGHWGLLAALSFNGNKIITTGGGGAIFTNNESLAKHAKHLTTTAKVRHAWRFEHDEIGYNYRLPNINAALGCAQLEQIDEFLARKRALAEKYATVFSSMAGFRILLEPSYARSNYWLNAIIFDRPNFSAREDLLEKLQKEKIFSRPIWEPLHTLKIYAGCPRMDLSSVESLKERIVNLPSSPTLLPEGKISGG